MKVAMIGPRLIIRFSGSNALVVIPKRCHSQSPPGSGAGKGGGAGGFIKESGGGLGKYAAAQEEGYFYNKSKKQLKNLKKTLKDEGKDLKKK